MPGIGRTSEVTGQAADSGALPGGRAAVIRLLAEVECRDPELKAHLDRVCGLSLLIAHRMGLGGDRLLRLRFAAILHDVGKLLVPEGILEKPARLTLEEVRRVRRHAVHGEQILKAGGVPLPVCRIVRWHHERYNGKGYPDHLRGEEIPLDARILGVADAYDAMTAVRPYHQGVNFRSARRRIAELAGRHFDPQVVDHFLSLSGAASASFRAGGALPGRAC